MPKYFEIKLTEKELFLDAMKNRILLFDGAMGTEIQRHDPKPEDFPNNQDGFNDGLVLTHPEWIKQIHRNYLDAGSDCIETNSFVGTMRRVKDGGRPQFGILLYTAHDRIGGRPHHIRRGGGRRIEAVVEEERHDQVAAGPADQREQLRMDLVVEGTDTLPRRRIGDRKGGVVRE